jgi:hypothetical protein
LRVAQSTDLEQIVDREWCSLLSKSRSEREQQDGCQDGEALHSKTSFGMWMLLESRLLSHQVIRWQNRQPVGVLAASPLSSGKAAFQKSAISDGTIIFLQLHD